MPENYASEALVTTGVMRGQGAAGGESIADLDPEVARAIAEEATRQADTIEMIASENYASPQVLEALGSPLTNKYAEGYPGKRYYRGCDRVDVVEQIAIDRAKMLFGAEHANVQPHSGSQANAAAYLALVDIGDTILAMSLAHGGHLTHGKDINFSGKTYRFVHYGTDRETGRIDYDRIAVLAEAERPKIILSGASAYSRTIDFPRLKEIADSVGAYMVVDMAHIAGLVAGGAHPSPVPYADVVTATTHKTLRGPRGGLILCRKRLARRIDRAIFPGTQGGPLMHVIAAKAVAFGEALRPEFARYQHQIVANAQVLAQELTKQGFRLVSGGTDNHMMLVDLTDAGITGADAAVALERVGIACNKNAVPFDQRPPTVTSGIRLGTPAATTRGMGEDEMRIIAGWIGLVLRNSDDEALIAETRAQTLALCSRFPIPA